MEKRIITISREFGSGGRYIGECVAQRLGYTYYDKKLIEKIAEETGLSQKFIEKTGEYAPSKNIFAYSFVGRDRNGMAVEDYLNNMQSKIIHEIAEEGPCVIVGRCADDILQDRTDCAHVFIHGDMPAKVKRIMELYNLSENEAKKRMREMDKRRRIHYNYFTNGEWGAMRNYTITLNSSRLGIEKCIDIICGL